MNCHVQVHSRRFEKFIAALTFAAVAAGLSSRAGAAGHEHVCRYCQGDGESLGANQSNPRQYAPVRQVDLLHIKLDVTPDFKKHTVSGTATLRFKPLGEPLGSLRLDGIDLDVREVKGSHAVRDFSTDDQSVTIVFEKAIAVGEEGSVEIAYSAAPVQGFFFRTAEMGLPAGDDHCWTQGEPHEARHWFPSFDYPNERASSEIVLHVPRAMTVVSNGRLVEEKDEQGDLKAVHWLQEKPHANYLICVVAGYLKKLEGQHGDTPLGFYTQPSKARYAANAFDETAEIMAFFEEEIGVPFPWEKYDQATCADYHWGGMENTTLTTLTQRTILADEVENVRSSRSLNAHEMAHQWFGDYVTCKDWSHLWLNEGFATYYALLYEGRKLGRDDLLYGLYLDAREEIFPAQKDHRPIVYKLYKEPREQFDFRNYPKGSWVLHMLRSLVGEDLYREAIRTYLKQHALGDVVTDDLRQALEELSGRPLDRFFDQWVYHGGLPELKVSYKWLAEEKIAHVAVEQTQETGEEVLMFALETKLRFIVDGKAVDEPIKIDGRRHDFYVKLPAEPEIVRFDPEYTLLARVTFDLADEQLAAQLKNKDDAIGRILACEGLAKQSSAKSVELLKQALNADPFWGVRVEAAAALRKIRTSESIAALAESTDQQDARVRNRVVAEIGDSYDETARKKLLAVVDAEQNPMIAATAIRGLANYRGKATSEAVRKALKSETFNNEPVGAAFSAGGELNDGSLAPAVIETIKSREAELDPRDVAVGMSSLAKVSQKGKRRQAAFEFLAGYLNHPRHTLCASAARALGELKHPEARKLLEALAGDERNEAVAAAAKGALESLDKETQLAPAEVTRLRSEVRELREAQEKLEKSLEELKGKAKAAK
ncbi:MAG: M1 family metallopeptidase [Pirellulales bacterium]|nr:M1 family metallopeptidase [Pirellulales bacterium]